MQQMIPFAEEMVSRSSVTSAASNLLLKRNVSATKAKEIVCGTSSANVNDVGIDCGPPPGTSSSSIWDSVDMQLCREKEARHVRQQQFFIRTTCLPR